MQRRRLPDVIPYVPVHSTPLPNAHSTGCSLPREVVLDGGCERHHLSARSRAGVMLLLLLLLFQDEKGSQKSSV